jgi:carboxyl-terminal processing protease
MKKKTFAALLAATVLGFGAGVVCSTSAQATPGAHSPFHIISQLGRVLVLIENEYVDVVERGRLIEGAIKGMVSELDPHSSYLRAEDFANFKSDTEGEFGGVGVEVDFSNDTVTVIAPIEGSPAARGGVKPGDQILAIDRRAVRGKSMDDLVKLMRGAPNTSVEIAIRRQGHDELLHFTLVREVIEVASVASKSLYGNVAYLRIKQYQRGTHLELLQAIGGLRSDSGPITAAILDLRNNPGGLVTEAVAVADEFLGGGLIYSTRRRDTVVDELTATSGGALTDVPLVVLVNEFSASAAELVAGALQDNGRAKVVGMVTFGKGSVQSIIDLPFGAGLRLTTLRYYTPGGHAIQAQGIHPDVVLEPTLLRDRSSQLVREEDLENHLPAEGKQTPPEGPTPAQPLGPARTPTSEEIPGISPTHLGVARVIPDDPTDGPDFALSVAYQMIRAAQLQPGTH